MTHIELQKEKASIINRLMLIDDAEWVHIIKKVVYKKPTPKFSPAALTIDELAAELRQFEQDPNPVWIPHDQAMQTLKQWR